jgi:GntR family transcriptional regulator/MocR family aminotransferase
MLRPWDFKIVIRKTAKTAVFLQIAHAIVDEIKRGRLAPGTALPGSRELAESLDLNRKTVIQAYAELEAQGWVATEKTRGTFVSVHLPEVSGKETRQDGRIPERPDFRLVGTAPNIPLILPEKNVLVFDDGAPDTRQIPVDALVRAYRNALSQRVGRGRLGYGDPRGTMEMRAAISNMLNIDR